MKSAQSIPNRYKRPTVDKPSKVGNSGGLGELVRERADPSGSETAPRIAPK